jgi:SpoVK/Ycf46/Vps4 family AAA+-type ATPase
MLSLMDGFSSCLYLGASDFDKDSRIVVIGATNRPNSIDEALRRPGRFDREFEVGIPDAKSRLLILKALFKNIKHSVTDIQLETIANKTHGYVGADLSAICREAGLKAVKRVYKNSYSDLCQSLSNLKIENTEKKVQEIDDYDDLLLQNPELVINFEDVVLGMGNVRPSVIREIMLEVPKVYWDDIGGQDDIKQRLKEAVEWPLKVFFTN